MIFFYINTYFSVCLQVGCEWVWLDSGQDYRDDSELSSDCRSLFSSLDSSLDLDVGSWKDTEDAEADELEESSPEKESSELLVEDVESEEPQEEAEKDTSQNLLHLLSEGEAQQVSKEDNQGEGSASDGEDTPPLGEGRDGIRVQEAPLVNILYNCTNSSQLFSSPFLKPVSEKQAPGYKDVVKRPMDLTTLKRNLSKGRIHTMAEFQRDLMLMFQNAVMYNDSDHHIYHMAVEMQREVLEQIQVLSTWLDKRKDLSSLE
ncbi:bromodomain-containing protein 8-like isoform X2 [Grammomys surdaster]|uniref:bromodomain-containing protein 8-like isoform X2 n=1 Tax=Grammomys surdaster TaxID=491861 RepID=UPI00109F9879|nr:bromodomain-containing protein 8-like isoform X2 [Grammomys surdaster]